MECEVSWLGEDTMAFSAHTESGHTVNMDGAPEAGGKNQAPRPMELLLAGTGGCTAFDVVLILKKGRNKVSGCRVLLTAHRAEQDPKVFTYIKLHFQISGEDLDPNVVERAVRLSAEKYCSASAMLGKTAQIEHTWEILSPEAH